MIDVNQRDEIYTNEQVVEQPIVLKKCAYKTNRCTLPCALKKDGQLHSLCELHRLKQNDAQKKSDLKRRKIITERRRRQRTIHTPYSKNNVLEKNNIVQEHQITRVNITTCEPSKVVLPSIFGRCTAEPVYASIKNLILNQQKNSNITPMNKYTQQSKIVNHSFKLNQIPF